ncbi:MAG TPA: PQQ-binding-like beta-propeller repeat protein [Gemmataceae bacterium]|nr:PQQ-binding-like beta-propeller repeat protein [Gemmataceae bacterium]
MSETNEPRRLKRVWMPVATLILGVGGFAALVLADALEPMSQFLIGSGILLVTPLLLVFWLLFLSGLRWYQRLLYLIAGSVAVAGLIFGLTQILRVDGAIGGSGIPRLRWIWTRSHEAALADLRVKGGTQVELSSIKDTDYPQFLGRDRDGVARGVRLVRDWNSQPPKELWRKSIGLGWSAFAVAGDYAITQEQREDKELVVCYELKTGNAVWKHEHEARFYDKQGGDGPRATPTIVDGRVYTLGGTGILDCIDGATGKNIWTADTLADYKLTNLIWGKSCSPLVFDDKVIVTGGQEKRDCLLAYHRETGKPLWHSGNDAASYSSPILATLDGQKQILSVNAQSVTGHDPDDGKVLWTFGWPGEMAKASQPVPLPGDRVFLSAGYRVGCVLLHVTRGSDGQWEVEQPPVWVGRNKMCTQFSNVLIAHNCAFGLDCRELACIDLETGERKWKGKTYEFGQILLVGDSIVVQAEDGSVALVEANPNEFKELARLPALHEKTWNNPVLSGPYLLLRNDKEAVCYQVAVQTEER